LKQSVCIVTPSEDREQQSGKHRDMPEEQKTRHIGSHVGTGKVQLASCCLNSFLGNNGRPLGPSWKPHPKRCDFLAGRREGPALSQAASLPTSLKEGENHEN
jgi:hypothetical protein